MNVFAKVAVRRVPFGSSQVRAISLSTPMAKKAKQGGDISQIPIKHLGVLAPYYIPPPVFKSPVLLWHKLVFRRMGQFLFNTYSVYKFKNETGRQVHFNQWKDDAIDIFVRTNRAFSAQNLAPVQNVVGVAAFNSLQDRLASVPKHTKLQWELLQIEENPKVVSFNALPDNNGVTAIIQFVMKLKTRQQVTVTTRGEQPLVTDRVSTDYLVYTLDPFLDELCLVGSLFECDHLRPIQPEMDVTNYKEMMEFQKKALDIFRQK